MNMAPTLFKTSVIGISLSVLPCVTLVPKATARPAKTSAPILIRLSDASKKTILNEHNKYRSAVNVPALQWSSELEQDAKQWAAYLAIIGGKKLIHADSEIRKGQGENLWRGSAGYFSHEKMVQTWANEKKHFRAGVFPNVSQTGNGYSVSHYTQVVWKDTARVGCAQARAGGNDLLVCRYDPAGNIQGQRVF